MALTPRTPPKKRFQFKVHAQRNPASPDEHALFVAKLNQQFGLIADQFTKIANSGAAGITQEDLDAAITTAKNEILNEVNIPPETATETDTNSTSTEGGTAVLQNAQPTTAPPNIAKASALGTTVNPIQFSYADHTHGDRVAGHVLWRGQGWRTFKRPVAGSYGDATHTVTLIIDQDGRIQSATNTLITATGAVTFRQSMLLGGM